MMPSPRARDRVALHGLSSASYNGRVGVVIGPASSGDRLAVRLSAHEEKALRPQNLEVLLPTLALPLVVCGADVANGTALLQLIVERREQLLLERGAFIAVCALVGREGAVYPAKHTGSAFTQPCAGAPHGGLDDTTLAAAISQPDLRGCQGYQASAASGRTSHRRLGPALRAVAAPSLVVVDVSDGTVGARHLVSADFRLERYGGVCVALGASPPGNASPAWLRRVPRCGGGGDAAALPPPPAATEDAAAVLAAVLGGFTGWLPPLVPAPARLSFGSCIWCRKACSTVCAGCTAVAYCSAVCQHRERVDSERGGLCHAAYCEGFGRSMRADVSLEGFGSAPAAHAASDLGATWLAPALEHGGQLGDECAVLRAMGAHRAPYTLFCPCVPDGNRLPDGEAATLMELLGALPPPRLDEAGRTLAPPAPLTSWAAYYEWRGISRDSPVALLLTFALTTYHAIQRGASAALAAAASAAAASADTDEHHDDDEGVRRRVLCVHYLGPASRELNLLQTFSELATLLPSTRMRLCLVGPAAPPSTDALAPVRFEGGAGGWLEVTWHRSDYLEATGLPPADLAVACNSGIFEYETWQPAIGQLADAGVPFVFTDYSEGGLLAASIAIREAHGLELSVPPSLNPFRQPFDRRLLFDRGCAIPWMSNGYLAALLP